jgi:NAD(P)-dependent dehydrogenase (short-subunit alcohol dehydrogenase family)
MSIEFDRAHWALILGGSSGFGLATAKKLARCGMNVAVVHRDRKGAMVNIEPAFAEIRATGVGFAAFNVDALSEEGRRTVLDALAERMGDRGKVRLVLHSIAYGNLKLLVPPAPGAENPGVEARRLLAERLGVPEETLASAVRSALESGADALSALADPPAHDPEALLDDEDFARTIFSMGTSLATWTKAVLARRMFAPSARVVGMTSEGNEVAWRGYAAVAAAKVALESVGRALALELAPYGVRTNIVQAGVTDTPALRLIPGSRQMKAGAKLRNPFGRLTTPADVADFIALLCTDEAAWVNGTVIRVDGGERIGG